MKTWLLSIFIFPFVLFFTHEKEPSYPIATNAKKQNFHSQLSQFTQDEITKLSFALKEWKKHPTDFKKYQLARKHLKRLETLWAFVDAEQYNAKVNAAPLLKPEKGVVDFAFLYPQGFQVIDEILAEENPSEIAIKKQISLIEKETKNFSITIKRSYLNQRVFMESMTMAVNRWYNFGLSNFDTPGTPSEITDAKEMVLAWQEMNKEFLYPILKKHQKSNIIKEYEKHFDQLLHAINQPSINYLSLLREGVLPLQKLIKDTQESLGIEFKNEVSDRVLSYNPKADHFFAEDFLNANYFSGMHPDEHHQEMVKLGKLLFNDPILSANNQRACASCHHTNKAFADGMTTSVKFGKDGFIKRNAPGLINAIFAEKYFYDLRAENLVAQIDHVVTNPHEFNTNFGAIEEKLNQSDEYKKRFQNTFPSHKKSISKYSVSKAINSYLHTLKSFNSPFDQYVRKEKQELPESAKRGFNLFMNKGQCATCHFAPLYSGLVPPFYTESESEVLGVWNQYDTLNPTLDEDLGRWNNKVVRDKMHFYKNSFKTLTIRNIKETAPYMHHGAFTSLEEVLDFYNRGGGQGVGLNVEHQTLAPDKLNLSPTEIKDLISFMNQLSDNPFINQTKETLPKFKNPEWNKRVYGGEY
ncbi:MAG: cytochrome-c peroxidase [Flavobacteriales bacterium]|jgi:cytochrome c peroxidase|nr:cytochrome-c peroxidase [Flavobacteriales bacterium]